MNILVLNAGSSSVKFTVFSDDKATMHGVVKEIGSDHSSIVFSHEGENCETKKNIPSHKDALHNVVDILLEHDVHHVDAVGHRVVHGGDLFISPTVISNAIVQRLEHLNHIAPLHNPANLTGIKEAMHLFDHVPHVAVFDTAFHSTIPEHISRIALPEEFLHQGIIKKYGFHGTSHQYAYQQLKKTIPTAEKVISMHIGNGISITAIDQGKSINNSMGFTPLDGPIMGTRVGELDFGVAEFLYENDDLTVHEISSLFNHQGGLMGIAGISDIKQIYDNESSDPNYKLALAKLVADISRFVAGYTSDLGGIDSIIFTGGAGEAAYWLRERICKKLSHFGIQLDSKRNKLGEPGIISSHESDVTVMVVKTDEERMIAQLTEKTVTTKRT